MKTLAVLNAIFFIVNITMNAMQENWAATAGWFCSLVWVFNWYIKADK